MHSDSAPTTVSSLLADPEKKLTRSQAALVLGIGEHTLATWATTKRHGLPYIRVGRAVRYRAGDLLAWLETRTVRPAASE